jgi:hypothetical protein
MAAVADTCAPPHRLIAYDVEDACVRACAHAIGWQWRRRRRLDRRLRCRRSRRPSSAVPPVRPAAIARRSNPCATPRCRRVVSLLYDGPLPCVCAFVCVRATACVCVRVGVCRPSRGTAGIGGVYSSARGRPRVRFALEPSVGPQVRRGRAVR